MFADECPASDGHKTGCLGQIDQFDQGVFIFPVAVYNDQHGRGSVPLQSIQPGDGLHRQPSGIYWHADHGQLAAQLHGGSRVCIRRGEVDLVCLHYLHAGSDIPQHFLGCAGGGEVNQLYSINLHCSPVFPDA